MTCERQNKNHSACSWKFLNLHAVSLVASKVLQTPQELVQYQEQSEHAFALLRVESAEGAICKQELAQREEEWRTTSAQLRAVIAVSAQGAACRQELALYEQQSIQTCWQELALYEQQSMQMMGEVGPEGVHDANWQKELAQLQQELSEITEELRAGRARSE